MQKGISSRQSALVSAIRKYNKYCDTLGELADSLVIPLPRHLPTKLAILRDDPYLMEDVWVYPVSGTPSQWLTDSDVRKGIRAMLKLDQCGEEHPRLSTEAANMCAWFGRELTAVTLAIHLPESKQ